MILSYLFWYKILFMSELLIAELMFAWQFPKRDKFPVRLVAAVLLCFVIAVFYPLITPYTWFTSALMFVVLFAVTIVCLFFCFKIPFMNMLFCAVAAYTVQHFSYEIFNLINMTLMDGAAFTSKAYSSEAMTFQITSGMDALGLVLYLFEHVYIYLVTNALLKKRMGESTNIQFQNAVIIVFIIFVLLVNIVLSSIVQNAPTGKDEFYEIIVCVYNILCCLTIFYIQMSMIKEKNTEQEMAVLTELYKQHERHYNIFNENNEVFNRKYHDLKHYIHRYVDGATLPQEAVDEFKRIISTYDTKMDTGNEALDIILTEKRLMCNDKGVTLTCMADGKCISFMSKIDLYALFGNILDNAIEAVLEIDDKDKRCVNFHLLRQDDMVIIKTDNFYESELDLDENGLPKTTKDSKEYHGFGMKSIGAITEKYGGNLHITTTKNMFKLSIIIPYKEVKEDKRVTA